MAKTKAKGRLSTGNTTISELGGMMPEAKSRGERAGANNQEITGLKKISAGAVDGGGAKSTDRMGPTAGGKKSR